MKFTEIFQLKANDMESQWRFKNKLQITDEN